MSVKVQGITKNFSKQVALNNVSFEINTGEIVGFIGPNGAGKSTMMKTICGLINPDQGTVLVNDVNIFNNSLEVRKMIGYLPENNPLYPEMYIKEFLEFVAGIHKIAKPSNRIIELIELTGLEKEKNKKIGTLSKGYKQRVGLAQALIHNPEVLILDEPTTGLDPNQILEIRNLISETGKSKTIMLSTHIMQEVEAICDRIIIINQGKIVANDLTKNIYSHSTKNEITVLVEFSEETTEAELLHISGVSEVRKIDKFTWLLSNFEQIDIREKVFNYAVENKKTVLSIQKKDKRLEDVFKELTLKK